MSNFLFAYKGAAMAETPEAQEAAIKAWMGWFGTLGDAVVDGGAPFGASTAVTAGGARGSTTTALGGYSVIRADDLELAAKLAEGCPVFAAGGSVEVYEALAM